MTTKDGKYLEKIVALIEKSIDPSAVVEHDVDMPILTSKEGCTTQCDVVIWSGQKPRQFVTICEVQDRGSQMLPQDVRGFIEKMNEVGAQRVICISRKEFSKSNKERAAHSGGSLILITIKDATPETLPVDFNFCFEFEHLEITKLVEGKLVVPPELLDFVEPSVNTAEEIWSVDGVNSVSLDVLCRAFYSRPEGLEKGIGKIYFNTKQGPLLYLRFNGGFVQVNFECEFEWEYELSNPPLSVLTYEQGDDGTMAWLAEVLHESPKGPLRVRFPLVKLDGKYKVGPVHSDLPAGTQLSVLHYKRH